MTLLSLIIAGALASAFQIIAGSASTDQKRIVQEEGNFVLRKFIWALSGVSTVTSPIFGMSTLLSVTKYDGTSVDVRLNSGKIEMRENFGSYLPLTTDNVKVVGLEFTATGSPTRGITASTTISGQAFSVTKYFEE